MEAAASLTVREIVVPEPVWASTAPVEASMIDNPNGVGPTSCVAVAVKVIDWPTMGLDIAPSTGASVVPTRVVVPTSVGFPMEGSAPEEGGFATTDVPALPDAGWPEGVEAVGGPGAW